MEQTQQPQGALYAVYGTLRQGFGNNRILQNESSQYLGTETKKMPFRMVSLGGFPALISSPKKEHTITIEVFRVTSSTVEQRLDNLEGYPGWYDKVQIETQWGTAYVYTMTEDQYGKAPLVESGDWKEFANSKY